MRYIYLYMYLRCEFTRVAPERPPVGADQELLVVEYESLDAPRVEHRPCADKHR